SPDEKDRRGFLRRPVRAAAAFGSLGFNSSLAHVARSTGQWDDGQGGLQKTAAWPAKTESEGSTMHTMQLQRAVEPDRFPVSARKARLLVLVGGLLLAACVRTSAAGAAPTLTIVPSMGHPGQT